MSMPTPQDIGLNFNCEYVKQTDENSDFGYYGSLSFNISGHILDYKFDDFGFENKKNLRLPEMIIVSVAIIGIFGRIMIFHPQ